MKRWPGGRFEAGVKVASAYPGTPSTEITENIAKYDEVYSEWSPNEKVAFGGRYWCFDSGSQVYLLHEACRS